MKFSGDLKEKLRKVYANLDDGKGVLSLDYQLDVIKKIGAKEIVRLSRTKVAAIVLEATATVFTIKLSVMSGEFHTSPPLVYLM